MSAGAVLLVAVPAMIGAAGSVLSAYIAVKVRQTSTAINGEVSQLRGLIEDLQAKSEATGSPLRAREPRP